MIEIITVIRQSTGGRNEALKHENALKHVNPCLTVITTIAKSIVVLTSLHYEHDWRSGEKGFKLLFQAIRFPYFFEFPPSFLRVQYIYSALDAKELLDYIEAHKSSQSSNSTTLSAPVVATLKIYLKERF